MRNSPELRRISPKRGNSLPHRPLAVAAQPEEPEGAALCPGILASARFHLHTSLLEGVDNRIKVIKRMAYGFRDSDYFFLKIKAAFPGKMRWAKERPRSACFIYPRSTSSGRYVLPWVKWPLSEARQLLSARNP